VGLSVIAVYRPREGREDELLDVIRDHLPVLRQEGLATGAAPVVLRTDDGTLIEVFEWASEDAVQHAHENPRVQELWNRFAAVSDNVPLAEVPAARERFATVERVEL
jgi:quinol monooxygenase YgiN